MRAPGVALDSVSKRYGPVQAVDRVTLAIREGEFFTLLGASGSGKTTILRLIGGFEEPDTGTVTIQDRDVTLLPAYRRDVHTVFQDYALFPHLTVSENVAFPLRLKRVPEREIKHRVTEALLLVQLSGLEKRMPAQLSGGQKQRVALARATVDHPAVLLLDEPLSALDAKIRGELREELKRLQRETRITFVYVTHDQEEALALSSRMAVMRAGKVLQVGTPMEVYEHPADLYVAGFVGKANFLSGTLVDRDGEKARVQSGESVIQGISRDSLPPGGRVKVMVRPENLILSRDSSGNAWEGRVLQAQYLGHATGYLVAANEVTLHAIEIVRRGTVPYREGETVHLSWDPENALVFADSWE